MNLSFKTILLPLAGVLILASCEKVIDVNPRFISSEIMIEGELTDDSLTPASVKISRSLGLNDSRSFPEVSGAIVVISDGNGVSDTLKESKPGLYISNNIKGRLGATYKLNVVVDNKTYTATSTMPSIKVPLDTITITNGFNGSKVVTPRFFDPVGLGNFYRLKLQINNEFSEGLFLFDDKVVDGGVNQRPMFDQSFTLETGDKVRVKMMCINEDVYQYFFTLDEQSESGSPANPPSNIQGAKLGYFSAHTVSEKTITMP
jgi:Domain of unknown function (DUF4249)